MQKHEIATAQSINVAVHHYGLLFLFLIAGWASTGSGLAQCITPPAGLIGWWPGSGNVNDIAGTNNGTLQGGATANTAGWVGTAFNFDGTNNYVQIPDSTALRPTNLTIEAWVRFDSLNSAGSGPSPAGQQYIVFRQNSQSASFEGFALTKTRVAGGDLFTFVVGQSAGQTIEVLSTTFLTTGVWYHVAGVRGSNFAQIYVNGQLQGSASVSFAQNYGNFPLYFGTSGQSSWDHKFKGSLDEVSLYNRPLSSTEIGALYTAGAAGKCYGLNITTQPQSQTVLTGSNATFTVSSVGTPPFAYQWYFNGGLIDGATSSNLVLTGVQPLHSGNYTVGVSDSGNSLTSAVAVLTVVTPVSFAAQPQNATNDAGTTAIFAASATGSAPLSYRWRLNGSPLSNGGRISGATTNELQISNVQPGDAGNYSLVVSNAAGPLTSAVVTLTVTGPPAVQTPPVNQNVTAGANVNFSVIASGTQPLGYQWQRNGVNLSDGGNVSGVNASTLSLFGVNTNDAGSYRVVITNIVGSVTSVVASLTINVPPVIITQPAGQTAVYGTNVSFNVIASSPTPISYQWRFNNTNLANGGQISGATTSNLTVTYVLPINAGGYSVVLTNSVGSVTSTVAGLTVVPPTDCLTSPSGLIGWWTGDGNTKDIVGTNNGTYFGGGTPNVPGVVGQAMRFDGTNNYVSIPDSPQLRPATLTIECWVLFTSLNGYGNTPLLGQQYMVFKNNSRNCNNFEAFVFSKDRHTDGDVFLWEVTSPNGNLIRSDSKTKVTTNTWYHTVGVAGTNYLEMYINGVMETNVTFNFPLDYGAGKPLMFGSSGETCYDRKLHGYLDEVALYNRPLTSNEVAALYANAVAGKCKGTNGLLITTHPLGLTTNAGNNVTFTSAAVGGTAIGYQWQFNGSPIAGATGASLTLSNVQPINAGSYRAVATNASGTQTTGPATLTVLTSSLPSISGQPTNQTVIAGNPASFNVTATGPSLSYQWRFNGGILGGETNASLLLANAQPAQEGGYSVVVSNFSGSLTSDVATLTVLVPPGITVQPTNRTVIAGNPVSFNVAANGSSPRHYQWRFGGANLGGETADALVLASAQSNQAGNYTVVITNAAGAITSAVATLTVLIPPYIVDQPHDTALVIGSTANLTVVAGGTGPFSYQWKFSGTNLPGAAASTLTLNNVQPGQSGDYFVIVSSAAGSTNSDVALLSVVNRPVLLNPSGKFNSPFVFTLSGVAGHSYMIEVSTNFQNWTELGIIIAPEAQTEFIDTSSSNSVRRFYRARFMQ